MGVKERRKVHRPGRGSDKVVVAVDRFAFITGKIVAVLIQLLKLAGATAAAGGIFIIAVISSSYSVYLAYRSFKADIASHDIAPPRVAIEAPKEGKPQK